MINFVVAPGHGYTVNNFVVPERQLRPLAAQVWAYPDLFLQRALPAGTWIFCDVERLAPWELRLAAEVAQLLSAAGTRFKGLNHPARAASRYELLVRLRAAGLNRFRAWRAEDGIPPARLPVFIRNDGDHGLPLTRLLDTPALLRQAYEELDELGIPKRGLLVVEYEAEPIAPGIFRKYAAYRFGDNIVADHMVHDVQWNAKFGNPEAWTDGRYREELAYVRTNPHHDHLMRAFRIAGIDYGRADYGLVGGALQIWEINTNPTIPAGNPATLPPQRAEAAILSKENRWAAVEALDTPHDGGALLLESTLLQRHREVQRPGDYPIRP